MRSSELKANRDTKTYGVAANRLSLKMCNTQLHINLMPEDNMLINIGVVDVLRMLKKNGVISCLIIKQ